MRAERTCPLCGRKYAEAPALSRTDNKTLICPECCTRQALDCMPQGLISDAEKEEILEMVRSINHTNSSKPADMNDTNGKGVAGMVGFPSRDTVEELRRLYPPGTRVILDECSDPYQDMPSGMEGVVTGVDDAGQLHANWSNGSSLAMVYGVDHYHRG